MLEQACRQVQAWRADLGAAHDLHLSVNLSPDQVRGPDLVERFDAILDRTGYPADALVLELTEGVLVGDNEQTLTTLNRLRQRGARIAIDDFGTGYSSLGYLTRLPIDILKIDRCFIAEMSRGPEGAVVAEAIIRLSQTLHLETVAEGIEIANQADGIKKLGCSLGQGYYFARPLDAANMETFLQEMDEPATSAAR